ncbi:ATP-binding Cassette (ABC) Superfamily, partial [Thraustotheca clavata]
MSEQRAECNSYTPISTPKSVQVKVDTDAKSNIMENDDSENKASFFMLYRYASSSDIVLVIVGVLFSIIHGATYPFMAVLFGNALNNFMPYDQDAINNTSFEFAILAVVLFISGYGSYTCFAISAEKQMKSLRREVLKHIMYQEINWYDQRDVSELASRIAGDTVKIKEGMGEKLGETFRYICQFLAGYVIGFSKGWNVSLAMCAVMPFMALAMMFLIKKLQQNAARSQEVYAAAGAVAEETIGALRTVASLNGEQKALKKYTDNIQKAEDENTSLTKYLAFAIGWFFMSMWLTYAIGLWYGGYLVSSQNGATHTPGSVFAAFYGILTGTMSLAQISPSLNAVASAKGSAGE